MNAQPNHPRNIPHLLSIEQVAERLGVTVRHVRRLVFERRITYVKWGHLLRFDPESVDRFVTDNTYEPLAAVGRPPHERPVDSSAPRHAAPRTSKAAASASES